jgi:hypothetical protein
MADLPEELKCKKNNPFWGGDKVYYLCIQRVFNLKLTLVFLVSLINPLRFPSTRGLKAIFCGGFLLNGKAINLRAKKYK